ncbi:MAG: hypothetical protein AAGK78_12145, partial [Planctomycetota bacterium]
MPAPLAKIGRDKDIGARRRRWAAACVCVAGLALAITIAVTPRAATAVAAASEGAVYTVDGQLFEGEITETDDQVSINVGGIVTTLDRDEIRSIEYGSPEVRLRRRLDEIGPDDTVARLRIGQSALRRGLLDLASEVAEELLEANPANLTAQELATRVARQRRLEQAGGTGSQGGPDTLQDKADSARDRADAARRAARDRREKRRRAARGETIEGFATEAQINRIRQIELQPADDQGRRSPTIRFENRVVQ